MQTQNTRMLSCQSRDGADIKSEQ